MDSLTSSILYKEHNSTTPFERKLDRVIELLGDSSESELPVNVKYFNPDLPRLEKLEKGDWIDVRVDQVTFFKQNDEDEFIKTKKVLPGIECPLKYYSFQFMYLHLGFTLQLPEGYEAYIKLRSSTFEKYGFIQVNEVGIIDESYCGNNDEWIIPVLSIFPGQIYWADRVGQFRIETHSPGIKFNEVDDLQTESRGGFGSTGNK